MTYDISLKHQKRCLSGEQNFINKDLPYIMHIDLNACFAIIEQQANRLLRGRPVGVAAYDTPKGFVLAASYEAKAMGIKMGTNVEQARAIAPGIVIMTPDPDKYREAHKLFRELMLEYTPDVIPKSIDEFVLNFEASPALRNRLNAGLRHNEAMLKIGKEIKAKIKERLGEWVTVNIGIATNRFLAKYGAGFDKPDGMTLIDHTNLESKYKGMKLIDLPGINVRFRARLRLAKIYTPLDFLSADLNTLKKQVFKSINGYYWYLRLRGHEIDNVKFSRKSIGHQHALSDKTTDINKLERLLLKLCEKTGRRLRKNNFYATGIHLYLGFIDDSPDFKGPIGFENTYKLKSWHQGKKVAHRLYSTLDIYEAAKKLLNIAEISNHVRIMAVNVYGLEKWDPEQLSIFDVQARENISFDAKKSPVKVMAMDLRSINARKRISDSVDAVNNRYGEFVLTPAMMMEMQGTVLDRIAFGQVQDI
jgi:DNA polymerase IV